MSSIPQVGAQAEEILQAARAEAERHTLKVGEPPTNPDLRAGVNG